MKCPIVVQMYGSHNLQAFPGTHHEVFPSGHGHEVDMMAIADRPVIYTDLWRWSKDMTASVPGCVTICRPEVVADHTWSSLQRDSHVKHMSNACHTHVRHMASTWQAHAIHMSSTCRTHVKHMSITCQSHVKHMPNTCRTHVKHMSCTCQTHVKHMSNTCQTHG